MQAHVGRSFSSSCGQCHPPLLLPRLCLLGNRQQRLGSATSAGSLAVEEAQTCTVCWFPRNATRVAWSEQGRGTREIPLQQPPWSCLPRRPPTNRCFVLPSLARTSKYSSLQWQQAKQNGSELEDDQLNGICGLSHLEGVVSVPGQVPLASSLQRLQSGIVRNFEGLRRTGDSRIGYKRGGLDMA